MPSLTDALSSDRFGTYLTWAGGATDLAERLYTYNVRLSAALYGPLHMLEVTMHNKINVQLAQSYGAAWLNDPVVLTTPYQTGCVRQAEQTLRQASKPVTTSRIVAELNFGFRSSLFGRQSHHLWHVLWSVFLAKGVQRSAIAHELRETRVPRVYPGVPILIPDPTARSLIVAPAAIPFLP